MSTGLIRPAQQDDALLDDIAAAEATEPEALHLWWLGQSGFLVSHARTRFVFDPYLSDSLTRKYAATDKPHIRMTERVIAPERLSALALAFVTSSHNHTDHLDAETLVPLLAANPEAPLVLPEVNIPFASQRLGPQRFAGLSDGAQIALGGIRIEGVPAAHEALAPEYLGFVVRVGRWTLYHSGDTVRYEGMTERLAACHIDLALLPINGRAPERRVSGNLWGDEAAQLAHDAGIGLVVPCHYELFTFNTDSPARFEAACTALGQPFATLRAGERLTLR